MKNRLIVCVCIMQAMSAHMILGGTLNTVERDAQKNMHAFNELSKNMSIADLSESIVSNDAQVLKNALHDVMDLNQMVNAQVNTSIQLWNIYLDSVKIPSMETYLLGQVMNSIITAMRAITLRCSVDQSMILSLVKKHFNEDDDVRSDFGHAVGMCDSRVESRWKSLRIE